MTVRLELQGAVMLNVIIDPNAAWMADALCAGETTFTEWEHPERLAWCRVCPVRPECRAAAPDVFWGAKSQHEHREHGECRAGHKLAEVGTDGRGSCLACRRAQQSESERRRYARAKAKRSAV